MTLKLVGAFFVLFGCGSCGFSIAASEKREEYALRQIVRALEYMDCDLQFHQSPLPQLCSNTAVILSGQVRCLFETLAKYLNEQAAPDASCCMRSAIKEHQDLPKRVQTAMQDLGDTLGLFDLPGQLKGIASVKALCYEGIRELSENRASRLRSYQTLGLCTGAALAILFL